MDFDALTITFNVNNAAVVEISGEAGFRRCINNRTLTRTATVTVYRGDEPGAAMPAGQVPELAALFDEILGAHPASKPARPSKGEPQPEVELEPTSAPGSDAEPAEKAPEKPEAPPSKDKFEIASGPILLKSPAPRPVTTPTTTVPKGPATPSVPPGPAVTPIAKPVPPKPPETVSVKVDPKSAPPPVPPVPPPRPNLGRWLLLGLALVAIFALVRGCGGSRVESGPSLYAVLEANVRDAPSTKGGLVGKLSRGDAVKGEPASGDADNPWVKLKGGALDGRYVWSKALGKSPPPPLSLKVGAVQRVRRSGPILSRPADGDEIGKLRARSSVFVVGQLASGWWEINRSSVVGYARPETFTAPAAAEAPRPIAKEESAPSRSEARPAGALDCATSRTRVDQMVCGSASLRDAHARTMALYDQLYRRSPTPQSVREEQAAWMRQRSQVVTRFEVLEGLYLGRIRSLEAQLRVIDPPPPPVLSY